jgi:PAS domain S-box-containing protein
VLSFPDWPGIKLSHILRGYTFLKRTEKVENYLDITDVIFLNIDAYQKVLDINARGCEILGYEKDEILGRNWFDSFLPERVRSDAKSRFKTFISKGTAFGNYEIPVISGNGTERIISWSGKCVKDNDDEVCLVYGSGKDLTELRRAESEARLISDSISDYITVVGTDYRIVDYNRTVESQFGGELKGRLCYEAYQARDGICPDCAVKKAMESGKPEFTFQPATKVSNPVEIYACPVLDEEGNVTAVVEHGRDVSDKLAMHEKLAERTRLTALGFDVGLALTTGESLREALQKCAEAFVQHMKVAFARVWTLNEEDDVLELQASAGMYTHIDGPHARVPVGTGKIGVIAESRQSVFSNSVIGDPHILNQEWARREGMVSFAGHPLVVDDRLVGVVAMFGRDLLSVDTAMTIRSVAREISVDIVRRHAEEALKRSRDKLESLVRQRTVELEKANEALRDELAERLRLEEAFISSINDKEILLKEIHHRVKNNLAVISSLLRLQSLQVGDLEVKDIFRESRRRVRAMSLIHEKLYRSDDLESVNVARYMQDLAKELFRSYHVDTGNVRLKIDVPEVSFDVETMIPCGLIINELISNALKHAFPEGKEGELSVSLEKTGKNMYVLLVRDSGRGFPKGLDFSNTKSLGMRIVTSLTDQMEGSIELDRTWGTEFRITFTEKGFRK